MLVQCENWCVMPSWKGDSGLPHYFKSEACNASVMFPGHKKRKKTRHDVHFLYSANQSEKHTQVHFLLADDRFHPHAVDNNEKSKTVCTHTLLLPVTPNTDISGTSQRDVHIHFANTQSQWKTDVLCLNTVKQSRGRAKSQIHLQQIVDVFTHT